MNQLHKESDYLKNNLGDIEMQLRSQEERLKLTLQVRFSEIKNYYTLEIRPLLASNQTFTSTF